MLAAVYFSLAGLTLFMGAVAWYHYEQKELHDIDQQLKCLKLLREINDLKTAHTYTQAALRVEQRNLRELTAQLGQADVDRQRMEAQILHVFRVMLKHHPERIKMQPCCEAAADLINELAQVKRMEQAELSLARVADNTVLDTEAQIDHFIRNTLFELPDGIELLTKDDGQMLFGFSPRRKAVVVKKVSGERPWLRVAFDVNQWLTASEVTNKIRLAGESLIDVEAKAATN